MTSNLDVALKGAMNIDGAIAVALVDYTSGMTLGTLGGGPDFDFTVYAVNPSTLLCVLGDDGINVARLHLEARPAVTRLAALLP